MKKNRIIFFTIIFSILSSMSACGFKKLESALNSNTDPLAKYAWHLQNTGQKVFASQAGTAGVDLNILPAWHSGITGKNIIIQVSDDGIQDTHEDLHANFPYLNQSKDYTHSSPYTSTTAPPYTTDDDHGTSVSGLIAAVAMNDRGSLGVAYNAQLISANFMGANVTQTNAIYMDQANGSFDISNMSWGSTQNTLCTIDSGYLSVLQSGVTSKRSDKGALYVKAAGNDFAVLCNGSSNNYCVGNSNFDCDNTVPYILIIGAVNALGESASYSSPGSNLWVSGYGGEFGDNTTPGDTPAMLTTDLAGCTNGYATSSASTSFENGRNSENSSCNYTSTFNGTSAASPTATGAIALILQANPSLTWRDVKYILAKTAKIDSYSTGSISHPLSPTLPSGFIWEQRWITNAANFKFHNWFGFGRIDVGAAVSMAQSYVSSLGTFTNTNWAQDTGSISLSIPDFSTTGASSTLNVTSSLKVEAVQIKLWVTHADISELAIELTSPSGTKSILVNARNSLTGVSNYSGDIFLSNAFYQENSNGNWTLKVIDAKSGNTGTLTRWSINVFGAP